MPFELKVEAKGFRYVLDPFGEGGLPYSRTRGFQPEELSAEAFRGFGISIRGRNLRENKA